ncbi:MAG TPA: hypothetical protein VKS24_15470 [Bradyrhizobium sp.]|nr:hypothetical protein [Bradyrhizobium sp.]
MRKIKKGAGLGMSPAGKATDDNPGCSGLPLDEADKVRVEAILVGQEHIGEGSARERTDAGRPFPKSAKARATPPTTSTKSPMRGSAGRGAA